MVRGLVLQDGGEEFSDPETAAYEASLFDIAILAGIGILLLLLCGICISLISDCWSKKQDELEIIEKARKEKIRNPQPATKNMLVAVDFDALKANKLRKTASQVSLTSNVSSNLVLAPPKSKSPDEDPSKNFGVVQSSKHPNIFRKHSSSEISEEYLQSNTLPSRNRKNLIQNQQLQKTAPARLQVESFSFGKRKKNDEKPAKQSQKEWLASLKHKGEALEALDDLKSEFQSAKAKKVSEKEAKDNKEYIKTLKKRARSIFRPSNEFLRQSVNSAEFDFADLLETESYASDFESSDVEEGDLDLDKIL